MTYNAAQNAVVRNPELKLCPLLKPHLHNPTPLPFLVLDLSTYQIRPHLLYGLTPSATPLVRELDCACPVVGISQYHPAGSHL